MNSILILAVLLVVIASSALSQSGGEIVLSCRNAILASPLTSTSALRVAVRFGNSTATLSNQLQIGVLSAYLTITIPNDTSSLKLEPLVSDAEGGNATFDLSSVELEAGTFEAVISNINANSSTLSWTVIKHDQPQPATDTALVRVAVLDGVSRTDLAVWGTLSECYKCAFRQLWTEGTTHHTFSVTTDYASTWELRSSSNALVLTLEPSLVSGGEYILLISNDSLHLIVESADFSAFWLPLVVAAVTCIGLALLGIFLFKIVLRLSVFDPCLREKPQPLLSEDEIHEINSQATVANRVSALDTFRGFTMTWMVFVNYGAGGYWFLDHAVWNGLHVADLLFPWFIMIMGTSMALSYKFLDRPGLINRGSILYKLFRRSVILVALGLFFNNLHTLAAARVFGVLQRFGVTYFVVGLIILFVPRVQRFVISTSEGDVPASKRLFADFLPYLLQWLAALVIVSIYLCIQFFLPVPGCPTGYLGPGGLADGGKFANCTGGAHGYVDSLIAGVAHIYQYPTCMEVYQTGPYDPEGTLGYLTSVLMAFFGLQAGRILTVYQTPRERIVRWAGWGVLCGAISLALSGASQNGGVIPINKNLWSPSFVTATSSLGFFLLIICYLLVDVLGVWNGAPFIFVGLNPILIYCCHGLLQKFFPFSFATDGSHGMELLSNLIGVAVWLVIAYRMHLLKFYVKI